MNTIGRQFRVSLFGESHGAGVGVLIDGVPAGQPVDGSRLQAALDARRPGRSTLVSARSEPDRAQVLSGVHRGKATGAPIAVWIANQDADSRPYADVAAVPRPGHADWVNHVWSGGHADLRGGGHSSGRLTAGLVAAGVLAEGILSPLGISCAAHVTQVGDVAGPTGDLSAAQMAKARSSPVGTAHKGLERRMVAAVEAARKAGDSVGGAVAFAADGLPVGLGDPWMDPLESTLAHLLFAVPAVKAVSFGEGARAASMAGSGHNDAYAFKDGGKGLRPATNHAGGIVGGRSTGERLWGEVAIKPASSIARAQVTADVAAGKARKVNVAGRHDPCIAIRAAPVVAACVSIALADAVLLGRAQGIKGCWPADADARGPPEAREGQAGKAGNGRKRPSFARKL